RVAARAVLLGGRQTFAREARGRGGHGVGRLDLDPEVVQRAGLAVALDEDELERRVGHGEVGVAGLHLRRLRRKQLRVEGDRLVEVGNVERKLDSGHRSSIIDVSMTVNTTTECCASVVAAPLAEADAEQLARAFAALADPVRLRLLSMIASSDEVCS